MKLNEEPRSDIQGRSKDNIQLMQSLIHRQGVFATAAFQSGQRIIQYLGEKISSEECERREELYGEMGVTYLFDLENGYAIDGGVNGNIAVYINHSCDPNCIIEIGGDEIWVIARRPIAPGEELTYDYWFDATDDETTAIRCCCGATSCRGTINRPQVPGDGNDLGDVEGDRKLQPTKIGSYQLPSD